MFTDSARPGEGTHLFYYTFLTPSILKNCMHYPFIKQVVTFASWLIPQISQTLYRDTFEHIHFFRFLVFVFSTFSVVGATWYIKHDITGSVLLSTRENSNLYRIVSYRQLLFLNSDLYRYFLAQRFLFSSFTPFYCSIFQCFDTVGWAAGRASGL